MQRIIGSIILVMGLSGIARGVTVEIPLDVTGMYRDGALREVEIDFSEMFTEIESMSLEWSGAITAEVYTLCGNYEPSLALPGGFIANVHYGQSHVAQAISDTGGVYIYPDMEPFGCVSEFTFLRNRKDHLLDGPVVLRVFPTGIGTIIAIYCPFDEADGVLDTAVLQVEGTPLSLSQVTPKGGEAFVAGSTCNITWQTGWSIEEVVIEYSYDNGSTWSSIATTENTGSYVWNVPLVNSNQCLIRISDALNSDSYATSNAVFTVFECQVSIPGDVNGDCYVSLEDLAIVAEHWLRCGNPFDPGCQE